MVLALSVMVAKETVEFLSRFKPGSRKPVNAPGSKGESIMKFKVGFGFRKSPFGKHKVEPLFYNPRAFDSKEEAEELGEKTARSMTASDAGVRQWLHRVEPIADNDESWQDALRDGLGVE